MKQMALSHKVAVARWLGDAVMNRAHYSLGF